MRERGERERDGAQARSAGPGRLRAIAETLRRVPERLKRPESLLMLLAMFASIGVHMPPYLGLGALADYFEAKEREKAAEAPPPISFEVTTDEAPKPSEPPAQAEKQVEPEPPTPEPKKLARDKPRKPPAPKPEPKKQPPEPEKKLVEAPKPLPLQPAEPPPPPPPEERKQSITQKSQNPEVEPPPDSQYLAEENQRIEEETVASVTSETKNDPNPQAAAPESDDPEKSGDSLDDERGAERGSRTEQAQRAASRERRAEAALPRPAPSQPTPAQPAQPAPRRAAEPARSELPSGTVFRDPLGSFVVAPAQPSASDRQASRPAQAGRAGSEPASNLKVSWRAFEQTFGAEQLAQDRLPREAKRRGAGREKRWSEFRAAIENYVVGVKPGNTTALNAAADPFAAYLAAFHRNLHMEFAHDFLSSLPMAGELGDPSLVTKVEIVVNPDGSLDRVGVVKSSGNLMYDFGAFNAVQRGAPYPPPPEKVRSPDGRVYMRWALHRNESQCGTWNAEPYLLKTPPRSPNDPKRDNVSPFRQSDDSEHGEAPASEPRPPARDVPAVAPDETLGHVHPSPSEREA